MQRFACFVNPCFLLHRRFWRPQLLVVTNRFIGEANYSKASRRLQVNFRCCWCAMALTVVEVLYFLYLSTITSTVVSPALTRDAYALFRYSFC